MGVYDIDIRRLALLLLPAALRRPLMAAFAQSAVQGVNAVRGRFMLWKEGRDCRLSYNGQVCRLRGALNDAFDPEERRIRVEDGRSASEQGQRVFLRVQERHTLLPRRAAGGAFIINRCGFSGASGRDFRIVVPVSLRGSVDEDRLAAITDTYKLASKRWTADYEETTKTQTKWTKSQETI